MLELESVLSVLSPSHPVACPRTTMLIDLHFLHVVLNIVLLLTHRLLILPTKILHNMPVDFPPAIENFLKEFGNSRTSLKRPVAVFDCDGTIIKGDIGEAMFYHQVERFLLRESPANIWVDHPKREELDNLYTTLASLPAEKRTHDRRFISFAETMLEWYFDQLVDGRIEKACSDIVKLLTKFSEDEVHRIATATLKEHLDSPISVRKIGKHEVPNGVRYIREPVELLKRLQRLNFDIWIVSGSNRWSVEAVFDSLDVPKDHIIGVELLSANNTLGTRVQTPIPVQQGKVHALQQFIPDSPMIVVSDSSYDMPLFEYSIGLKVFVNSRMETSYSFFKNARITPDDSWAVFENPTLIE